MKKHMTPHFGAPPGRVTANLELFNCADKENAAREGACKHPVDVK